MLPINDSLPSKVKDRNIAMNWLLQTFPKAFDLRNRKPLKSNIMKDVFEQQLTNQPSPHALNDAFHYYTQWGSYLAALKQGASCFDLNGEYCGKVTKQEEEHAILQQDIAAKKIRGHHLD